MFLHRLVQSCQQSIIQRDTLDSRRDSIFQDKTRFNPERRLEHANIVCEYSIQVELVFIGTPRQKPGKPGQNVLCLSLLPP